MYPAAAGYDQLPGGQFTPSIWSGNMLANYYEVAICADICNTDYEGEISDMGSEVIIRRDPTVEIRKYYKGMKLETQSVDDSSTTLVVDQGVYYNFPVDDVERRQSDVPWVEKLTSNASVQNQLYIDTDIFSTVYVDVPAANILADQTVTNATVAQMIVDIGVMMDEAFVPDDGKRWIVVPHWLKGMVKMNPTFVDASAMGDDVSMIRNGYIGMLDRMKVYGSSLLTTVSTYTQVLAGHPQAITFATQYTNTETLRNPNGFGDLVRGLQVYGHKVTQPGLLFKAGVKK